MITKLMLGMLLGVWITRPGYSWNLFAQGPLVLTLNAVILVGLVGFLIYIKNKERGDE